ncbi:MAG: hypothetical protein QM762_18750 [Chryseolinea sp.]
MKKLFTIIVFTFIFVGQINAQFRAGAALRVITPNPLLPVSGGIGVPKPSTEKKGDLFVRAVVFEKNGTKVAIVSVDNLGWPSVLGDQARALVKGIPPQNIMIGATHTHSAPDAYGFPDEKGKNYADLNYLKKCVTLMAEAIQEADKNLQPASLKIVVGEAKGKIAYNYYAPDLYDPRCGVIQAIAESGPKKGQAIATLVNYAIHPEVIGSGRGILSPDLCGPLYDRIESRGGGMALFMNGAQGGMVTADTRAGVGQENNTWEECQRIGNLLADEALRLVEGAEVEKNPDLACSSSVVTFPIDSEIMQYILKNSPLKMKASPDNTVSTVVNYLKVGSARALTIPGEALPNVGYYVKRKMNASKPFLFGLTNDAFGYMLTREDFNSFKRYEYVSRTSLGERTADIYVEEALKLVERNP